MRLDHLLSMENGDKENISEFEVKITEMLSVLFNFEGPEQETQKE